ncbi:hypothetical protein Y032_0180g822 [Ancylostoma ceylanicum]|uniref:Uncharacterized protein n=1 Tax=Ancylostoma ceylanicum TaxID=53326 RepID=A0A016STI1_9BILA|nr:hypothetical protein Y032_0180g822 [Ancylostoma ceylanicum]
MLESRLDTFYIENQEVLISFERRIREVNSHLLMYMKHYPGLERVMFLVCWWAKQNRLLGGCLQEEHVCIILILFATGTIAGSVNVMEPILDVLHDSDVCDEDLIKPTKEQYVHMIVAFYEYLASRPFRILPHLSFESMGCASTFLRGQWVPIHEAAVKTYYNLVFHMQFGELTDVEHADPSRSVSCRECEPFVIELPDDVDDELVRRQIMKKTNLTDLSLRRIPGPRNHWRVAVSARGTIHSLRLLRDLVTVKPPFMGAAGGREASALLPLLVYKRIMS